MNVYKMTIIYLKSLIVMLESIDKKPEKELEINVGILTEIQTELSKLIQTLKNQIN